MMQYAQAPIAPGSERCVRVADGGCVAHPEAVPIGAGDVSFLVDAQLESSGRHPVLRLAAGERVIGFDLERSRSGITGHFWLGVESAWFYGRAALSATTGKRLVLRIRADDRVALADEIQPWGPDTKLRISLSPGTGLARDWHGFRVGGASGEVAGESYRGRLAEVAIFDRLTSEDGVETLRAASLPRDAGDVPSFNEGALGDEGRELFLDHYGKLVRWHNMGSLSREDVREATALAHLWLLDRYPLLQRVSDHFGAMLSFPDLRRSQTIAEKIEEEKPALWWPENEHEGDWVPLSAFRDDLACWLEQSGQAVTWAAFIKFLRNKLGGGGHYDPEDRARWQQELIRLARQTEIGGEPWLAVTMLTLVRSLIIAADGSGLTALARNDR